MLEEMNTNTAADSSIDCYPDSSRKGVDSAPTHLLDGKTPTTTRGFQRPFHEHDHHPVARGLEGPIAREACGAGAAHRVGANFSSASRHFVKPSRDCNWGQRGTLGTHVHRDPCLNGSANSGKLTPPPPVKVDELKELASDLIDTKASETAVVTGMMTGMESAADVGVRSVGKKTPEGKRSKTIPPSSGISMVAPHGGANKGVNGEKNLADDFHKTSGGNRGLMEVANRGEGGGKQEQQRRMRHHDHQQQQKKEQAVGVSDKSENAGEEPPRSSGVSSAANTTSTFGLANCTRPVVILSVYLVALYKRVNEMHSRQRRLEAPGPKYNNGFDDKDGHYLVLSGEEILSRYTVQEVLGKGSFGTVLRCFDEKRRENVALKITRHGSSFRTQAKLELDILMRLNLNQNLNHLVVKLLKVFDWQGHLVLVFELLSFNLYQLIKCTRYNGVTLDLVRKFAYQLVQVLYQLDQAKPSPIIHCDIKPENILLKNQNRSGIRLIDFGSACYLNKVVHKYIQSRYYRSPEVILYLEYGTAIDRWSLGCVLVELHTGVPLFDGKTEAAQLSRFEGMLGPVPPEMLEASPKAMKFYEKGETGYKLRDLPSPTRSLESVIGVTTGGPRGLRMGQPGHSEKAYRQFHDFLSRFLCYKPSERMSCYEALRHPFLEPLWSSDQQQHHHQQQPHQPPPPPVEETGLECK